MSVEECEEQGDHGPVCPQKTDLSKNIILVLVTMDYLKCYYF